MVIWLDVARLRHVREWAVSDCTFPKRYISDSRVMPDKYAPVSVYFFDGRLESTAEF